MPAPRSFTRAQLTRATRLASAIKPTNKRERAVHHYFVLCSPIQRNYSKTAKKVRASVHFVQTWVRRFVLRRGLKDKPGRGRKRTVVTPAAVTAARKVVKHGFVSSVRDLQNEMQRKGHAMGRTSLNEVKARGEIESRVRPLKPALTDDHKARRLAFAKAHAGKSISFWKSVLWTDEAQIEWGQVRQQLVCRGQQPKSRPRYHTPLSVRVWGAISPKKRCLVFYEGNLTKQEHLRIVRPRLGALMANHTRFQMDGARVHNGTKELLVARGVRTFDWPPSSPDLSIIENVWGMVKSQVEREATHMDGSVHNLKAAVKRAWNDITQGTISHLVESLPKRLEEVIDNNGGNTHY